MNDTQNLLSVIRLKKHFPVKGSLFQKKREPLRAVDGVSLQIRCGETYALVGESGCGKSTLGRLILGLLSPSEGAVIYHGATIEKTLPKYLFTILKNPEKAKKRYDKIKDISAETYADICIFGGFLAVDNDLFFTAARLLHERFFALKKGNGAAAEQAQLALQELRKKAETDERFITLEQKRGNGVDLCKLTEKEWRTLRSDLQIVFQDPYSSLNPRKTVGQMIAEGAYTHGYFKRKEKALNQYVLDLMQSCGLQPFTAQRYPHEFSGGQRQRVCIARALSVRPKFIVCDECVSALDVSVQAQILNLLSKLKKEKGLTYLFISHDMSVVRHVADRVGVMYLGKIVETGETENVFKSPRHPYTIALLSAVPTTKAKKSEPIEWGAETPAPAKRGGCPFHTRCFMAQEVCAKVVPPMKETEKGHFTACHFAEISTKEKLAIAREKGAKK